MIHTVADLLLKLRDIEKEKIDALGITHTPTIGNMYEGLTKSLLDQATFRNLNLSIVRNSFIKLKDGTRSAEMDVLLIEGVGVLIPHTIEQYEVTFDQVVVVIQSKKKINKQHLEEAYHNLKNVYDVAELDIMPLYAKKQFRDAYKEICREDILDNGKLRKFFDNTTKEFLFHVLRLEAVLPPRIVFGYEGYTTEDGLRKGFISFLEENVSTTDELKHGFSPLHFPNLIINGNFALIKNNAMPYIGKLDEKGWPFYSTSNKNPLIHFLEIVWTRLSYKYSIDPIIFGDDLDVDESHVFLHTNIVRINGMQGWNLNLTPIPRKILNEELTSMEWQPVLITEEQHCIIAYLCKNEKLLITKLNSVLNQYGMQYKTDDLLEELLATGLVYIDGRKYLKLFTEQCQCVVMKEGTFAAENKSGRLTRWVERKMGKKIENILDLRGMKFK